MIKERAIDAGAFTGAAALVVTAWWLAGQMRDHPAGAPIARPAPTVTVTQAPAPIARRTTSPAPSASQRARPPSGDVTTAAAREPRTQAVAVHQQQRPGPGAGAPSGPAPSPTTQQPASTCTGTAAVQLLGRCALTVGGR